MPSSKHEAISDVFSLENLRHPGSREACAVHLLRLCAAVAKRTLPRHWWSIHLDDFTQALAAHVLCQIPNFRGGNFPGWVFRVAQNHALSLIRRLLARGEPNKISLDQPGENQVSSEAPADWRLSLEDPAGNARDSAIASERDRLNGRLMRHLIKFLEKNRMIDPQRTAIFEQFYFENLSYREISARHSGLKVGTIGSILNRMRNEASSALLELLQGHHD